jgi:lantibiotic biosynthesis protein
VSWRPILDGELAAAARRTIDEIGDAIAAWDTGAPAAADHALFWAYVAGFADSPETSARYDVASDRLIAALSAGLERPALYGGLSGAAFALAHISDEADEVLAPVDEAVVDMLGVERWLSDYDLISGLAGYAVYLLERRRGARGRAAAERGLARIVDHFERLAVDVAPGRTWMTEPRFIPDFQRVGFPDGYYNCGVAHGVPGVIAVLARIAAECGDERARALCEAALRWQWAQAFPSDGGARFPTAVYPGVPPQRSRTAWCYGDPGAAIVALGAGLRLGADAAEAVALLRECTTRPFAATLVRDAGICHGAAGLAHLYNRAYQATRDPVLADGARAWIEQALALRRPGMGVAGITAYRPDAPDTPAADLLEGAAGVGLVLVAALGADEPAWDRILVADLPVAA